jgi:hypothetical protein
MHYREYSTHGPEEHRESMYRDRELLIVIHEVIIVINGTVEMRSSG